MSQLSRKITIGGCDGGGHIAALTIGGGFPVLLQTMWKDRLDILNLQETAERIESLSGIGCGLMRFAVPDMQAAEALGRLAQMVSMPLIADIHFDHTLALRCMDFPVAKIRINPGNIRSGAGGNDNVRAVVEKAAEKGIAVRIGVNAGSLPLDLRRQAAQGMGGTDIRARALVEAAERELEIFDKLGIPNLLVSMKASGIADTIIANRIFSARNDVPLHIGITEAGPLVEGIARSSAALSLLLSEGIGDTIRISLSDSMESELIAAKEICGAAAEIAVIKGNAAVSKRLEQGGVSIISCPRCGRHSFDTHGFLARWLPRLYALDRKMRIAVMGCEVNGPEEARHADLGITGTGKKAIIFRNGKAVKTVSIEDADEEFAKELECN